jgi:hypothetical protein
MITVRVVDPVSIDPVAEAERTQMLTDLRAQYDALVVQLEADRRRQAQLQALITTLQPELDQTRAQMPSAQDEAATRQAAADALTPRVEEFRAARDAITARLLGNVDTDQPLLLLPVRLETRFMCPAGGAPELQVRVYPDEVHVDRHERALTDDEHRWGAFFQTSAAGNLRADAWRQLAERFGPRRAAWIAQVYATNPPLATGPARAAAWTRAPVTRVLPERWVAIAYRGEQPVLTVWGKPIAPVLATGPSPATSPPPASGEGSMPRLDDGARWMIDFNVAEGAGMALRLPLTQEQFDRGFERLVVFGVRPALPADAAAQLVDLLDAQRYTHGLSLLPQNTPTNNSEQAPAAGGDPDVVASLVLGPRWPDVLPAADDRFDGHWLAWALGLVPNAFDRLRFAEGTEQRDARRMNRQLWPQDTPWLRKLLVESGAGGLGSFVRDHFGSHVVARGSVPALRVGSQPYGVMAVTTFDRISRRPRGDLEAAFLRRLRALRDTWRARSAAAPSTVQGSDAAALMVQAGTSCSYVVQEFPDASPTSPTPPQSLTITQLRQTLLPTSATVAEPLMVETLDACAHRFDAWVTSLAARRPRRASPAEPARNPSGRLWVAGGRPARQGLEPGRDPAGDRRIRLPVGREHGIRARAVARSGRHGRRATQRILRAAGQGSAQPVRGRSFFGPRAPRRMVAARRPAGPVAGGPARVSL